MAPENFHHQDISKLRFLVTGGAGFIGSHIVEYLINHNAGFVRVIDNLSTGFLKNIGPFIQNPNFEFIEGDITSYSTCLNYTNDIHVIFHEAALGSVPRSIENPIATNDANVNGFLNILWAAVENKTERVIYASSSSVYGDNQNIPKKEELIGNPLSPYAVSKRINELYAGVFNNLYNLKIIGLRYFNVFGPRQNPHGPYAAAIPIFINHLINGKSPTIYGNGEQSRDFTYVDNIVQANIKSAFTSNASIFGSVLNIGAGGNTTINELFSLISESLHSTNKPIYAPARKGDVLHSSASIEKASKEIGYLPGVQVVEGIKKTIDYLEI